MARRRPLRRRRRRHRAVRAAVYGADSCSSSFCSKGPAERIHVQCIHARRMHSRTRRCIVKREQNERGDATEAMTASRAGRPDRTKAGRIAADLRDAIVSGTIEQGTRLYQDELAARFSTSITPVREALRQLHAEGLVSLDSHRAVSVSAPGVEQITGTYVLRRLVEPFAV